MFIKPVIGAVVIIAIALSCVVSKFYTLTDQQKTTRVMTNKEYVEHMKQVKCLADNVYYEAGNQSIAGKKAVAYVTLNRLQSRNWPNSVCEIVYQKTVDAATRLIVAKCSLTKTIQHFIAVLGKSPIFKEIMSDRIHTLIGF